MKKLNLLFLVAGLLALASCTPYEKVLYLQNTEPRWSRLQRPP